GLSLGAFRQMPGRDAARVPRDRASSDRGVEQAVTDVVHAFSVADGDRPESEEETADRVGDTGWLFAALDLDRDAHDDLHAARHVGRLEHLRATAQPCADT